MKLRSGLVSTIAAGALALGALVGAAPASAAGYTYLCLDLGYDPNGSGIYCAYSQGVGNFITAEETVWDGYTATDITNWTYPSTANTVGAIKQADVNLCMQLDHADGDIVRGAACNGDLAEQWKNVYDSVNRRTWFVSEWALKYEGATPQCLTWDNSLYAEAYIYTCTTNLADQDWGTS